MKYLVVLIMLLSFQETITIFDFSKSSEIRNWSITNDDVMGGISTSSLSLDENGKGVFSGQVSTENNGGFAMVRLPVDINLNNNSSTILIRLKGDGKQYQFRLKHKSYKRYWYIQNFKTTNEWQTIELKLKDFYPSFRGNRLNKSNFDSETIKEIAFLIGNKQNENFKLIIDSITIN